MISAKDLNKLLYCLKGLCSNNSACEFCPLNRVCEKSIHLYGVEYEDVDELIELVEEHE